MKLEMAKLLQDTIEETAGFSRDPEVAQDFADFVKKVFRGVFLNSDSYREQMNECIKICSR